jgi:hypothetical protein
MPPNSRYLGHDGLPRSNRLSAIGYGMPYSRMNPAPAIGWSGCGHSRYQPVAAGCVAPSTPASYGFEGTQPRSLAAVRPTSPTRVGFNAGGCQADGCQANPANDRGPMRMPASGELLAPSQLRL